MTRKFRDAEKEAPGSAELLRNVSARETHLGCNGVAATIGGMTNTTEARWRGLIAAQERSGLGVRAFAESRGLAPATMYWWRCRLRDRPAALVPVAVVDSDDCPASGSPTREPFELSLGSVTLRMKDVLQRIAEGCDAASLTPRLWKAARSTD